MNIYIRQKFDVRRADRNLSAAAACRIYRRRRRTGGGAHVCHTVIRYLLVLDYTIYIQTAFNQLECWSAGTSMRAILQAKDNFTY